MRYLLLICSDERSFENMTTEESVARMAAWGQYTRDLTAAGKNLGGERLRPVASSAPPPSRSSGPSTAGSRRR